MTGTAWILGAGFSKAISEHMPTMKELGVAMCSTIAADADLVPLLSAAERAAIRSDIPLGDLEVWLTSLASPQPFLNESENLRRAALSSRLTEIIADEIEGRRRLACGDERPKWLVDLITLWHYGEDAVLSLNYDTLVENCLESMALRRPDLSNTVVRTSSILRFYPRGVPREGGIWFGQEPVDTFEFLKLHGSTNWYALPGTVDVSRVDELIRGWVSDAPTLPPMLAAPLRGATKAILIPTADKSVGHAKPVFANIWRAARGRLENATELVLFGYSLPPSDSSIRALLSQSVSTEIPVTIIDPNAAAVRERLHQLGLKAEGTDMQVGSTEFDRALCRWATDRSHLVDWSLLDDCAKPFHVCARDPDGTERPVSTHVETADSVRLSIADDPNPPTILVRVSQDQILVRPTDKAWSAQAENGQPLLILALRTHSRPADIGTNTIVDVIGPFGEI